MTLNVEGLPAKLKTARLTHYRVDYFHSDSYSEWLRMGSPMAPNERQYAQLEDIPRTNGSAAAPVG